MTRNKVAWVIPTYPRDYGYYGNFLHSFNQHSSGVDPIVVLTDHSEANEFRRTIGDVEAIVLADYFDSGEIDFFLSTRSIINVKKILALQVLRFNYKRIVITDSEVEITRDFDASEILEHKLSLRFHEIENSDYLKIIAAPTGLLGSEDRNRVMTIFLNPMQYGWFSDLPIYESQHLEEFFSRYDLARKEDLLRLNFFTFDYILYQYHLVLCGHPYELMGPIGKSLGGSIWELGYLNAAAQSALIKDAEKHHVLWVCSKRLLKEVPSAIAVFNVDRDYRKPLRKVLDTISKRQQG